MPLDPKIEAQALDETESAMRDLVQVGINIGASRASLALMLRKVADDIAPKIIHPEPPAVQ